MSAVTYFADNHGGFICVSLPLDDWTQQQVAGGAWREVSRAHVEKSLKESLSAPDRGGGAGAGGGERSSG